MLTINKQHDIYKSQLTQIMNNPLLTESRYKETLKNLQKETNKQFAIIDQASQTRQPLQIEKALKKLKDLSNQIQTIQNDIMIIKEKYDTVTNLYQEVEKNIAHITNNQKEHFMDLLDQIIINEINFYTNKDRAESINLLNAIENTLKALSNQIQTIQNDIMIIKEKYDTVTNLYQEVEKNIAKITRDKKAGFNNTLNQIIINKINFYTNKDRAESINLLNAIENTLKDLNLRISLELEKQHREEHPVQTAIKEKLFGLPLAPYQKTNLLDALKKEIQYLHSVNLGFSQPSKSITDQLNSIEKQLIENLQAAKTTNELNKIETNIRNMLKEIEAEFEQFFLQ